VVAAHAVLGLEVADDRLDGGPAPELAFDLGVQAALLAGGIDLEAMGGRGVVAAVSGIGDDPLERLADEAFHLGDDAAAQSVPVIRIAGQRLDVGDELTAL
jgi:hypothetical protein